MDIRPVIEKGDELEGKVLNARSLHSISARKYFLSLKLIVEHEFRRRLSEFSGLIFDG